MNVRFSGSFKPNKLKKMVKKQALKNPVSIKCPKCDTSVTLKIGSITECPTCHTSIKLRIGEGWN